ncbi:MAG TPA: aldolase/citrate lyase family protein [Tepidisphaeraceae bacterium]|nr:aldolase/citrate lyase family protein [Tepidisphaeraceae bacterium]
MTRTSPTILRRAPAARTHLTYGQDFKFTLWTNDPALAARADAAGVDRIGLDLETLGKHERQKGLATWISPHREDQLPALRKVITRNKLFCRTNPINPQSKSEIERLLGYGVQVLMLPMFRTPQEVEKFVRYIDGRAEVVLLLENREAANRVEEIVRVPGIDNVHIGLNDLTLSLKMGNRFAVMATPLMDRIADAVRGAGIRFGVGGVGRVVDGDDTLPIPSDLIYAQYPRLGATAALISRAFFGSDPASIDLTAELRRSRKRLDWWHNRPQAEIQEALRQFRERTSACATW